MSETVRDVLRYMLVSGCVVSVSVGSFPVTIRAILLKCAQKHHLWRRHTMLRRSFQARSSCAASVSSTRGAQSDNALGFFAYVMRCCAYLADVVQKLFRGYVWKTDGNNAFFKIACLVRILKISCTSPQRTNVHASN